MNIVFFGSGAFGLPTLERLWSEHRVRAVVTQPDRPAGRSKRLTPTPVGEWIEARRGDVPGAEGVAVFKPENANEPETLARIRAVPADAWVVIAFGQKLGVELLRDRFAINLHASLLPRWRGAAPINHAILAGDTETGVSVITLAERMDAGLVLARERRPIDPLMTAGELHDALSLDGPAAVMRVLADHAAGRMRGEAQDESLATRAPKLSRADSWIDFSRSAEECRRRVHGLNPWPGVAVKLGELSLKLLRVQSASLPGEEAGGAAPAPGRIVDAAAGIVACAPGTALKLLEVQPAGARAMRWEDFARGRRVQAGECLLGEAMC